MCRLELRKVEKNSKLCKNSDLAKSSLPTLEGHGLQLTRPENLCFILKERSLSLVSVGFYRSDFGDLSHSQFNLEGRKVTVRKTKVVHYSWKKVKTGDTSGKSVEESHICLNSLLS